MRLPFKERLSKKDRKVFTMNIKTIKRLYPEAPVFTDEIKKQKFKRIRSKTRIYIEAERHIINKEYVSVITVYKYEKDYRDVYQGSAIRYFLSKDDVIFQSNDYIGKREQYFFKYNDHNGAYVFKDEKTENIINNLHKKYKMDNLWSYSPAYIIDKAVFCIKMEQIIKKQKIRTEKRNAQMKIDLKDFNNRIPSKLKKEIIEKYPVYLYEEVTDNGEKTCFCTSCRHKSILINLDKHLSERECPNCGKTGKVERVKQCKNEIENHHYMIWPELKDGKVLIRFFITERYIYKDEYEDFKIDIRETDREVISNYNRNLYENRWGEGWHSVTASNSNFNERAGMFNWYFNNYYCGYGYIYSEAKSFIKDDARYEYLCKKWYKEGCEINTAVEDWWRSIIEDVHLYKKADTIEKLEKVGLYYLTKDCYYISDFNYKASKLKDILKLTNAAYKIFTKKKNSIYDLRILQGICKNGNFDVDYYTKLLDINSLSFYNELYGKKKIINYLLKQKTKNHTVTYSEYKHYLETIEELGYDMKLKIHLFPRDFIKTDKRITEEKLAYNEELNKNKRLTAIERVKEAFDSEDPRNACIKRISDSLRKMKDLDGFMNGSEGLIVKVPETYADLKIEGISLENCIGTYIDQIAKGKTFIFFIRKIEDVDKPFFAMEYRDGEIRQIHGFANCNANEVVSNFCQKLAYILKMNKFDPKKILAAA